MGLVAVKDPALIAELEGQKPVSDPALLAKLEGGSVSSNLAKIDAQNEAGSFEEPSTFGYLFNRLKKGFSGFMGMPGDVVQTIRTAPGAPTTPAGFAALERTGRLPEVVAGGVAQNEKLNRETTPIIATSNQYRQAMGYDPSIKTERDWLRYTGGVAEMAGAGGPFALATNPATMLPLLSGVVGSGIGMEAAGDVASGLGLSREAGEVTGAVLGGAATALIPNAGVGAAGAIKRRFSPEANKAAAESQVSREIAGQLESYPAAQQNIERSLQVSDDIPGFTPSLPARSGAPGLLAEERVLVSKNPRTLNKAIENIESNKKAIADFVSSKFEPGAGPTAIQRVNKLAKVKIDRLEGMKAALDEKLDDALRVFESNPSNYENGNRLRELFFKQKEVYSGIRAQKYTEVYEAAERLGVKANIDDAVQYVDDVLKNEMNSYQQSEIPSVFRQLKGEFAKEAPKGGPTVKTTPTGKTIKHYDAAPKVNEPADVSFEKLHSLYKRTNADLASLRGSARPDKDFQLMLLGELKHKLTQKLAGFEEAGFGEVATKLKEANRFYAAEYLPRFKQGFGGDVAAKYASGEFRTPDQLVTGMITGKPNNTQAARDFKMLFAEEPEAWNALRSGYLDELYRNAGLVSKDGRINQKAIDTFLRKHEPTLGEFPQIKAEIKQLATNNEALLTRRAQIVAAEKKLASKDLFRLFQGRDPDVILTEAATNPNAMRVLAYQTRNNPGMAKGLARGIAEHVAKQDDPMAFLTANKEAIRIGLKPMGEAHFKNLETAVEAMTINARNAPPHNINATGVASDTIAEKLGSSPRAIIAHFLNVERGRTGLAQESAAFLGRWFDKLRRDHRSIAMEAVFYDKDAARALANLAKNHTSEKVKFDFITQMTALGVRAEVAGQE